MFRTLGNICFQVHSGRPLSLRMGTRRLQCGFIVFILLFTGKTVRAAWEELPITDLDPGDGDSRAGLGGGCHRTERMDFVGDPFRSPPDFESEDHLEIEIIGAGR